MAPRVGAKLAPPTYEKKHAMSVRLGKNEFGRLDQIAKDNNISLNEALHIAINAFFNKKN